MGEVKAENQETHRSRCRRLSRLLFPGPQEGAGNKWGKTLARMTSKLRGEQADENVVEVNGNVSS